MNDKAADRSLRSRQLLTTAGMLSLVFFMVASLSSGIASHISSENPVVTSESNRIVNLSQPEMIYIPAGSVRTPEPFPMVENVGDTHIINIEQPFYMSKFEITFKQWDECVEYGGCNYKPDDKRWGRENRPVINISWRDTEQYLSWLSRSTGKEYRLPTELEWEYAARAGSTERFEPPPLFTDPRLAWASTYIMAPAAPLITQPVETGETNAFGLAGIRGNVWEWTDTCFRSNNTDSDNTDSESCGIRILRGDHRSYMPNFLREIGTGGCAVRPLPGNFGFRVVVSASDGNFS